MRGSTYVVAACAVVFACACGTGDTRIDPGDLELRDLLGVSPETAGRWDEAQRASARRVFEEALDESGEAITISLAGGTTPDEQVAHSLASLDARRFADGDHALGFVRVQIDGAQLAGTTRAAPTVRTLGERDAKVLPALTLELSESWRDLPQISQQVLTALATDAGARAGDRVVVVPASRLPVIASYVAASQPRLLVNPVLLAAIDPGALALAPQDPAAVGDLAISKRGEPGQRERTPGVLAANGNPYSFYGSINECAQAERTRCEGCISSGDCVPVTTTSDGVAECNMLAADDGRGYYLLCINLALSISSVDACTADVRPSGCARDPNAASSLSSLEANAVFLDDTQCGNGLDACLAKIYGDSDGNYPGFGIDAGVDPVDPPRDIDVSCGDSCDGDKSANCEFSPNCNCEGPSCGNSFSCDSSCSDSNSQSGCNDNCQSCSSDDGGSSSGGGCGGDSSTGGSDCGGSCGDSNGCNGCSDSSGGGGSSGGSCGGSSGGGSSGGDCGGGGCGGDSGGGCGGDGGGGCGGGGGDSSCGGGGGGGGGCQVVKRPPSAVFAVALSMTWALLPVPLAAYMRRRSKKQKKKAANAAPDGETATDAASTEEVAS